MQELVSGVFRGEFEGDDIPPPAIATYPEGGARRVGGRFVDANHELTDQVRWVPFARERLLAAMPPPAGMKADFKKRQPSSKPAAMRLDDFDTIFREAYLEKLSITRPVLMRWCKIAGQEAPKFWDAPTTPAVVSSGFRPDDRSGDTDRDNQSNGAPTSRGFSEAQLERWYIARVKECQQHGETPSRDQDCRAAKDEFGDAVPRDAVRALRKKHAPGEWMKPGRKETGGN